jgi:hypothetical protein
MKTLWSAQGRIYPCGGPYQYKKFRLWQFFIVLMSYNNKNTNQLYVIFGKQCLNRICGLYFYLVVSALGQLHSLATSSLAKELLIPFG